jgi:Na+/melibiose symporter-like transporter
VFAGIVFALKAGLGLGGAVCGWVLGAAGFDPSAAAQSSAAQEAIRLSVSLIPAALFGVGCVALLFYPISRRVEAQMQAELDERRGK